MAGPAPAERIKIPEASLARREETTRVVDYIPFHELTAEQLAEITGGEIMTDDHEGKPWKHDSRIIEYPTMHIYWNSVDPEKRGGKTRHTELHPFESPNTRRSFDVELDETVVVNDTDQPGVVLFVDPTHVYREDTGLSNSYTWVKIHNGGLSFESGREESAIVTDQIRQAAEMALEVQQQREAQEIAA